MHELDLSPLQELRRQKADQLRAAEIDPYTPRTGRTHTTAQALAHYEALEAEAGAGAEDTEEIVVAGRVVSRRDMGKTLFGHLRDGHGQLQLYLRRNDLGADAFERFVRLLDLGDFVEATGTLFRTKTGEISLRVRSFRPLTKALNAPPEKWNGLQDVEIRYRQRYVDLIANAEVRRVFELRSRMVIGDPPLPRRPGLPRGRDARPPAALRRRGGPTLHHPPQRARPDLLPADRRRALPEAADRRRLRAGLRDLPRTFATRASTATTPPSSRCWSGTRPTPTTGP